MKYKYSDVKNSFHSQEPWINVLLLKHITLPLVYLMVNFTNITPNIISIISLLFGVASAFFYFSGDLFIASLLYFVAYIFDATDGKVARIKGNESIYGSWVDTFIDRFNLVIISTGHSDYKKTATLQKLMAIAPTKIYDTIGLFNKEQLSTLQSRHKISVLGRGDIN